MSPRAVARLETVRDYYEHLTPRQAQSTRLHQQSLAPYYRHLTEAGASILEVGCGSGELLQHFKDHDLAGIDLSPRRIAEIRNRIPEGDFQVGAGETFDFKRTYDRIFLANTLNQSGDIVRLLQNIRGAAHSDTRLVLNIFSNVWKPIIRAGQLVGGVGETPEYNWISSNDVGRLLDIAGWEIIQRQHRVLIPVPLLGIDNIANRWLAPFLPWCCMSYFVVARLKQESGAAAPLPKVSVIVPARNEAGNIEGAAQRTPEMGAGTELIFVEGGSSDDTWQKIQEVKARYPHREIKTLQQSERGKANAVWEGFAAATGDVLMILDADLTVPPEELPRFYEALVNGHGEFINGVRLIYPHEKDAMRFLNMLANHAFSLLFTWLLGQRVKDTLCGTKVFWKRDLPHILAMRERFGRFDPYGDFDMLLGAAALQRRLVDMPVNYMARTYGEIQINRWSGGVYLLKASIKAAMHLKFFPLKK